MYSVRNIFHKNNGLGLRELSRGSKTPYHVRQFGCIYLLISPVRTVKGIVKCSGSLKGPPNATDYL